MPTVCVVFKKSYYSKNNKVIITLYGELLHSLQLKTRSKVESQGGRYKWINAQ